MLEALVTTDDRRNVWVDPLTRFRDLHGDQVRGFVEIRLNSYRDGWYFRILAAHNPYDIGLLSRVLERVRTDHSPFPTPSTLPRASASGLLLAAAEAKLDVRGEGIVEVFCNRSKARGARVEKSQVGIASGSTCLTGSAVKGAFYFLQQWGERWRNEYSVEAGTVVIVVA